MCGICAYIDKNNSPIQDVISGLKILEYRGYDSAGIAYIENNKINTIKSTGDISKLTKKINNTVIESNCIISHTRWATHGEPNETNAHPHLSNNKKISIVHNGIIENYLELKDNLIKKGYTFYSDTDTEIIANLIEEETKTKSKIESLIAISEKLKGSYALAIIFDDEDSIYFTKCQSPLYIASNESQKSISSDIITFIKNFNEYYTINDFEFGVINAEKINFFNKSNEKIIKNTTKLNKIEKISEKIDNSTIMEKEINETFNSVKNIYNNYQKLNFNINLNNYKEIIFIGCGTAYHAGLYASLMVEKYLHIPSHAYTASEFRYSDKPYSHTSLYVFVSQSGETADTIACAKILSDYDTLALTNIEYSMLAKTTKYLLPIFAGREIAVASTKTYTSQCIALMYLIFHSLGKDEKYFSELNILINTNNLTRLNIDISKVVNHNKIFFIGRGIDFVTCEEASLKLKEISYINCIAIPAGELKHGSLALVDNNTLIFAIVTSEKLKDKTISNIEEAKSRGAKIFVITSLNDDKLKSYDGYQLIKCNSEIFTPIVSMIPFQYLSLDTALYLGLNPDKPRNLAKSVTVE